MSSHTYLAPAEWYASLPTTYVSACALLTDPQDRVLIVKPNYRPYWAIPGGIVEQGERPEQCAARECSEELGLVLTLGELLVVDWAPPLGDRPRVMVNFLFDGGVVADPAAIRLQRDELDEYAFLPRQQAADRLPGSTAPRIAAALQARKEQRAIYLPATA